LLLTRYYLGLSRQGYPVSPTVFATSVLVDSTTFPRVSRKGFFASAAGLVVLSALLVCPASAKGPEAGAAAEVTLASLPPEAKATHRLILSGGPFPYEKDGTVFGNRERLLPGKARGFYREYTVKTPGSRDRGARRIVCGGKPPTQPESCYYTGDHYASFKRISP
jgi:ribonuclease T1